VADSPDLGCWVTLGYDNGCWVTLVLGLVTQPIKFYLLVLNMDEIISHSENLIFVSAGAEISKRIVIRIISLFSSSYAILSAIKSKGTFYDDQNKMSFHLITTQSFLAWSLSVFYSLIFHCFSMALV